MLSDKELKNKLKPFYKDNYGQFYPAKFLTSEGYHRNICIKTGLPFWSTDPNRKISGDPQAGVISEFIGKKNTKENLSFIDVWNNFKTIFEQKNYTAINRYPTVARWNPTMEFTNSSIAAFQPYVISGEVKPPANPLIIPQFCVRFPDLDNVGISGQHCTGFIMIGQHQFVKANEWNQEKVFEDIYDYLTKGLGIDKTEIIFHEDAWAGGGNVGCCVEFFSKGVELGNQVYMLSEQTEKGVQDLKIKVLDMGMGMERIAWFSQATPTIYDAIYPEVINFLCEKANYKIDKELQMKYVPFSSKLNLDEVDDIELVWDEVSSLSGIEKNKLKSEIIKMSGIYSIADHTRTLLFVLSDGGLPSNSGGSYMLRVILRRSLDFIEKYNWNIKLNEIIDLHAKILEPLFPELKNNLEIVHKIINIEIEKYNQNKIKANSIIKRLIDSGQINFLGEDKLIELYDSNGISPSLIQHIAKQYGHSIEIPSDFFFKVSQKNEIVKQIHSTKTDINLDLTNINHTEILYYDDYKTLTFQSKILKIIDNYIILDKTYFYPTSGGQLHDLGSIEDKNVIDVMKFEKYIIHKLDNVYNLNVGDVVDCNIDKDRRMQLAQNHSGAHVLNAAAKKILGSHINQAGAKKTVEKAHLDITHFKALTKEEENNIENLANEIIKQNIYVESIFLNRNDAENKFGMEIYQGGAVPGDVLRLVNINGIDIEACGGTHVHNTSEIENIKILKTNKIQDGIVRITFITGNLAKNIDSKNDQLVNDICDLFDCSVDLIISRCEELFIKWKKVKKNFNNKKLDLDLFILNSTHQSNDDPVSKISELYRVSHDKIINTAKRFMLDLVEMEGKNKEKFN
ncbi:alanine--tRNA ligase [Candidatus Woesearchaeota archaeon]|jgi:alanyl-tRNA synthetase|nr:alanine--tRNA ligase [Candidatus Woesearchaeota archaeon]MBT4387227.1 alanine--tRNA ligase [Candidatus Woesearchaeota archaeon]MBT4596228.1 alanine--tRNA ligase [Candidatus Woesearchaeota archaeon]MBT5741549.1 alanine--tRNA ligase [Candidatus Woesearchaeota archaeon]MBT6506000.1 alanine--tRNA ligase [Candidatus Woesearchaeota archaeon]